MTRKNKTESIIDVIEKVGKKDFAQEEYIIQLEQTNFKLNTAMQTFVEKITAYEEEISHLKSILFKQADSGIAIQMSDEELIADIQLRKMSAKAKSQVLSLEDVKIFDLLVKNKRLAQGNSTNINDNKTLPVKLTPNILMQIASQKKTEEK